MNCCPSLSDEKYLEAIESIQKQGLSVTAAAIKNYLAGDTKRINHFLKERDRLSHLLEIATLKDEVNAARAEVQRLQEELNRKRRPLALRKDIRPIEQGLVRCLIEAARQFSANQAKDLSQVRQQPLPHQLLIFLQQVLQQLQEEQSNDVQGHNRQTTGTEKHRPIPPQVKDSKSLSQGKPAKRNKSQRKRKKRRKNKK
ncbi:MULTISPECIES: hypothetical protein [Syntrophotalea]|uniref:Uncharacterized protein n=2 Tax=Syntrophotalea TaxID=2812025 RepID=A0A1L3GHQ8_SYNAC|nr:MULTISPECIES: hypothetical protein [Syntrophotalea]APG25419.1 hypothetical protein A7E75_10605 [Syntrophotalea acetylenica]APG28936.1 hypothetical protein A7E78_14550 [Syntrophotalea acetylenivorans]APG43487.1 hypothetical protein A6070_04610 [Syntrophotalea acetylenica]